MDDHDRVITKAAAGTVAEVTARFRDLLSAKGVTIFAVIDQAAAARTAGLTLRDTVLVIFGNPAAGTPVMQAAPLSALDLPLKLLIWDDDGMTRLAYYSPEAISERHGLPMETTAALAAIHTLTDALAEPHPLS
ncbi:DUF302 domain-containing protein [Kribbella pittospori]|uniref:DUF302 domain-containing protein n=1 Tax=Kribbella pittospori TaxID=722689 RepID=A0A4R0KR27_9ACTN|nr:DUF302 domain-containing protein [Kribbella pittospori]TCC63353.1 DUF302 domain-containing protein [Kribbella pittospori]